MSSHYKSSKTWSYKVPRNAMNTPEEPIGESEATEMELNNFQSDLKDLERKNENQE